MNTERLFLGIGVATVVIVATPFLGFAGYIATKSIDHTYQCTEQVEVREILYANRREAVIRLSDGSQVAVPLGRDEVKVGAEVCTKRDWVYVGNKFRRQPKTIDN